MQDLAVWTRVGALRGGSLDLLHARFRTRHYAPHMHEEFAIGVCTDGVEAIRYRGGLHHGTPGTLLVIEPGEPHTGGPAVESGFAYRALYPEAGQLIEDSGGRRRPHFREPVIHDPALARELAQAHTLLSEGGDPLEAESRLVRTLATLVQRHSCRPQDSAAGAPGSALTRSLMERLADRMAEPPSLAQLAEETGLSRYQLLRAFQRDLGMPPYAWLAQHRVQRARALIDTGRSPAEAAALVGFADQAHLTRWFRRVMGVTPGVYRNSVQDAARPDRRPLPP